MVELRTQPARCAVTRVAGLGESTLYVIWSRCALVVLQVTGHACRRRQVVIVADVAIDALARRYCVCSRQSETCRRVIKARTRPGRGVVTLLASLRETALRVVRIRCALIVLQMARHTSRARQVVIVVDVAIDALTRRNRV